MRPNLGFSIQGPVELNRAFFVDPKDQAVSALVFLAKHPAANAKARDAKPIA